MYQVHQVPAYPNTLLIIFEIPIAITILIVSALVSFLLVSSLPFCISEVAKISSCPVNAIKRRGNVQLGSSFGSIFLFCYKSSRGSRSYM